MITKERLDELAEGQQEILKSIRGLTQTIVANTAKFNQMIRVLNNLIEKMDETTTDDKK